MSEPVVWRSARLRVGRVGKNKQCALESVLVSDSAPGLCVRTGPMLDTSYDGYTMPTYAGSAVLTINLGHKVGPTFYGENLALTFARQIADLFDWVNYEGSRTPVGSDALVRMNEVCHPLSTQSTAAYQVFLAAHKVKDEAQHAENLKHIAARGTPRTEQL